MNMLHDSTTVKIIHWFKPGHLRPARAGLPKVRPSQVSSWQLNQMAMKAQKNISQLISSDNFSRNSQYREY